MQTLTLRKGLDAHVHFRDGDMMRAVVPFTAAQFRQAIVMPNLTNPITTLQALISYRLRIVMAAVQSGVWFDPLMTIQIVPTTTPDFIFQAKKAGAVAGKVYPKGMTTNSDNGVFDYEALYLVFKAMEEAGMVLSLHGESPRSENCLDREVDFLDTLVDIVKYFPSLRVVLEHITTAEAVDCVCDLGQKVAATITAHHLLLTLNDVIGGKLEPHHFCKPVAKRVSDLKALLVAATSGSPQFFFGSDSAPHPRGDKECAAGCAGIFTAPVALPVLAQTFEAARKLNMLEGFVSTFGPEFYGLSLNDERIELVQERWKVPYEIGGVVPFMAGKELEWQVTIND